VAQATITTVAGQPVPESLGLIGITWQLRSQETVLHCRRQEGDHPWCRAPEPTSTELTLTGSHGFGIW